MTTADNKQTEWNSAVYVSAAELVGLQAKAVQGKLIASKQQALSGTGDSKSPIKTRGMDFSEVRPYQAGDDARQIDWRITAKYGKPFTKLYIDEKEHPVVLVCDLRSAMKYATKGDFKSVIAAKITALTGWLAAQLNYSVYPYLLLPWEIKKLPSGVGAEAMIPLCQALGENLNPTQLPDDITTLPDMIHQVAGSVKKGSMVFILSDFHDLTPRAEKELTKLAEKTTPFLIHIYDETEERLPRAVLPLTDGEKVYTTNMVSILNQKLYQDSFSKILSMLRDAESRGVGKISIRTDDAYLKKIALCYEKAGFNGIGH